MTIAISGHIDTSKAAALDAEIAGQLAGVAKDESIEFDCEKLDYISSTGLRVILKYRKLYPSLCITNVSNDVYNVFEMTGFTQIINVKKALRRISLNQCTFIGEGGNGAVYRINNEEIVKVSKHAGGDETMIQEMAKIKEAFILGAPTVISFDTVVCDNGKKGIIMEALDSKSLGSYLMENPSKMADIVPKYVELLRKTNAIETGSPLFHDIKEWLRGHLYLPQRVINDEEAVALASLLDEIPDSNNLVHFDGHVGNVLMHGPQDDRDLMLIDMGDTGVGHPVLEITGWAFNMLEPDYARGCSVAEKLTNMSREMCKEFCRMVMAEYFHTNDPEEIEHLVEQASLIGRIKSVFIAQRWASDTDNNAFQDYLRRLTRETLTIIPEIKNAIRFMVRNYMAV